MTQTARIGFVTLWIALKLILITLMINQSTAQFIYAGF